MKQARADGDRALAASIKALRRPSVAAWYVNLAARASLVSLREWIALGASLRDAQGALDMARVRELSAGRAKLENRVVRDLSAHLSTLGVSVSAPALEEVRATLRAALAGQEATDAVLAGRLDRALSYGGFGEVDLSTAWAALAQTRTETEPTPTPTSPPEQDPALLTALGEARDRLAGHDHDVEEAAQAVARAEAALAVAQRELREARRALTEAERLRAASAGVVKQAETALEGS